jgi:hypothetical protein
MAEKIKTGNTYKKDVYVTTINEEGESEPVDLSIYDDNYFVIKKDRSDDDSEAYIFKRIPVKGDPRDGTLVINLTPEETGALPLTSQELPSLQGYVQIGSSVTGEVHEVSDFKIKTIMGGVRYITPIDTSYDMGCITEVVGYIFDAGHICDPVNIVIEFGNSYGGFIYNGGPLNDSEATIHDPGTLLNPNTTYVDLGSLRQCTSRSAC